MYTASERILEVQVHARPRGIRPGEGLDRRYKMSSIASFIATGRRPSDGALFQKVAVQFPDELLFESVTVLSCIAERVEAARRDVKDAPPAPVQLFALADSTFGSCCPDEVTARHYSADAVVHLGYACFSQSASLPTFNDVPEWEGPSAATGAAIRRAFDAGASNVVVLAHPGLTNAVEWLASVLSVHVWPSTSEVCSAGRLSTTGSFYEFEAPATTVVEESPASLCPRVILSEAVCAPPSSATREAQQTTTGSEWIINGATFPVQPVGQRFVFVGPVDAPQLHQLVLVAMHNEGHGGLGPADAIEVVESKAVDTLAEGSSTLSVSLKTVQQRVRQRMFNIEHVKASRVVGVVVASLGIQNFRQTAERLRTLLITGGKRAYMIFIGHLNHQKLANFVDHVDCFCVVACPNSRVAHFASKSDGHLKPLVSPIEVAIALGLADFMSPAAFTTQFDRVLAVNEDAMLRKLAKGDDGPDTDGADAPGQSSLITSRPLNVAVAGSSAMERLHERHYVGLEPKIGETPVQSEVVVGRAGIAKGYAAEREGPKPAPPREEIVE